MCLGEADVSGTFSETLTTDIQSILSDQSSTVVAHATAMLLDRTVFWMTHQARVPLP